jgi:flagellar hook-associated protein 3 FlgL
MNFDPNYISSLASSISQSSATEETLSNELSSGMSVSQVGDNPEAVTQGLALGSAISRNDTFVQTASSASSGLQVTSSVMSEVVSQLTSAISLATEAGNGTLNASNRSSMVAELQGIQSSLLSLANTNYQGQYIFGGSQGATKPFSLNAAGQATYTGDGMQQTVKTPGGQSLVTSVPGSSVFQGPGQDVFDGLSSLIADLQSNTGGGAVSTGSAELSSALQNVSVQQSVVDTSLSQIQSVSTYTQTQTATMTAAQSSLVSADIGKVTTQLSSAEMQNQALISVVATLSKGSLFDYLK